MLSHLLVFWRSLFCYYYLFSQLVFNHKKSKLNQLHFFGTSIFLTVSNTKTSYSIFQSEYRRGSFVSNKCKSIFLSNWLLVVLELLIQPSIIRHPTAHLGGQQDAVAQANKIFSQKCHGKYHLVHQVRGGSLNVQLNFPQSISFFFLLSVSPYVLELVYLAIYAIANQCNV